MRLTLIRIKSLYFSPYMLFKRAQPTSPATETFPLTDTLIDFDDTIAKTPDHQRRKHELSRAPAKRSLGFLVQALATFALLGGALIGAAVKLGGG